MSVELGDLDGGSSGPGGPKLFTSVSVRIRFKFIFKVHRAEFAGWKGVGQLAATNVGTKS